MRLGFLSDLKSDRSVIRQVLNTWHEDFVDEIQA